MRMRFLLLTMRFLLLTSLSVLLLALGGCVPLSTEVSPLPTPATSPSAAQALQKPTVTPDPGAAMVVGRVVEAKTKSAAPLVGMAVRLAQVFWNADKSEGAFVLEGATSPSVLIQHDGSFVFANVTPADYVIVIGDPFGQNAIITEPDGKARVITLEAGKTLDVGELAATLRTP